jgi:hypothetical protein
LCRRRSEENPPPNSLQRGNYFFFTKMILPKQLSFLDFDRFLKYLPRQGKTKFYYTENSVGVPFPPQETWRRDTKGEDLKTSINVNIIKSYQTIDKIDVNYQDRLYIFVSSK